MSDDAKRKRGTYHIITKTGEHLEYATKPELTRALTDYGADDVAHAFKGHKLEIETETIDRVRVK